MMTHTFRFPLVCDKKWENIAIIPSLLNMTHDERWMIPKESCFSIVEFHIFEVVFVITVIVITFCKVTNKLFKRTKILI